MKRLKKKKKDSKKPTDAQVRRNKVLFGTSVSAAVILVFGLIYGYTALSPKWQENKALEQIESEDERERTRGMWNLARGHLTQHTARLCEMLNSDPSVNVRKSAPLALVKLNDPRAVPCIVYALGDHSDIVALAAMDALQQRFGGEMAWDSVMAWWESHKGEYEDAIDPPEGEPVVTAMATLLQDESYYVRLAAVKRLARLKHPAARPLLEKAAADPEEKVCQAAKEALEEL